MKTLFCSLLLSVVCTCVFAQKITGKWHCDKEVAKTLQMGYEDLYCTYKFKKNGAMVIKIKGESVLEYSQSDHEDGCIRRGSIKIKGHYEIKDGKISSIVVNDDVECFADEYNRPLEEYGINSASLFEYQNYSESSYKKQKSRHLRKRLLDYRFLWDWDNEPITITEKELVIGNKLRCKR